MKKLSTLLFLLILIESMFAQQRFVNTSDGVKLYVNIKGTGTPCLYLHGGPGSGSYWLEKFSGEMLEKHFTMIYLDQRGVGRSSTPTDGNYSMERMVKDFEEIREELGIDSWLLLGHSFGGILEMGYQSAHSSRIRGLIFVNCTLSMNDSFSNSWIDRAIEIAADKAPQKAKDTSLPLLERMLAVSEVMGENNWKLFYADPTNAEKMDATYNDIPDWNNDFSSVALTIDDYWDDFRKLTNRVEQPVLFFYGKNDWAIGPDHHKGVQFPNSLEIGCNVGHMPFLESPKRLEKAIDRYCRKYGFK